MKSFLSFSFLLLLSFSANAQPETQIFGNRGSYINPAQQATKQQEDLALASQGYIKPATINLSTIHNQTMNADQFGIHMTVPDIVSGCFTLHPIEYDISFYQPTYMDIHVKHYRQTPIDTQHSHFDCPANNQRPEALIIMSRDDLSDYNIQKIRFRTDKATDNFRVDLETGRVLLVPESNFAFRTDGGKTLIHYFGRRDNVITLHIPMAKSGDKIDKQVIEFAKATGLTLVQNLPKTDAATGRTYTYRDPSGVILNEIGSSNFVDIGVIRINRKTGPVDLNIYAAKPGVSIQ